MEQGEPSNGLPYQADLLKLLQSLMIGSVKPVSEKDLYLLLVENGLGEMVGSVPLQAMLDMENEQLCLGVQNPFLGKDE